MTITIAWLKWGHQYCKSIGKSYQRQKIVAGPVCGLALLTLTTLRKIYQHEFT